MYLVVLVALCFLNSAVGQTTAPPGYTSSDYDCVTKYCTKNNPKASVSSFSINDGGCSLYCTLDDGSFINSQMADKSSCGKDMVCFNSQCVSSTTLEACLKVVPDLSYMSTYNCQTTCGATNYTNTKQIPADEDLPCGDNNYICPVGVELRQTVIDRRSGDNMQRIMDRSAKYNKQPIMDRSAKNKPISERLLPPFPCGGGCDIPNYDFVCKSGECTPVKQPLPTPFTPAPV